MKRYVKCAATAALCIAFSAFASGALYAGNFKALQEKVNAAGDGATLTLSENYTYDISTDAAVISRDGIVISKSITINGDSQYTVDAQGISRVFKIVASHDKHVKLENLTVTKGGSTASGGGLYVAKESVVSLDNCIITKCGSEKGIHTQDGGAALFVDSKAKISFTSCDISENIGKDRAGGIYLRGNAVFNDCRIADNTGGSRGGGLYVDPGTNDERGGLWGGNVKMYGCTISGNKGGRGGGIYVNSENDTVNIFDDCTIESNDVSSNSIGNGGGILFYNAVGKLTNCDITKNKARNGGGLIFDVLSKITMEKCGIANNSATVGGAGIYAHDGSHSADTMKDVGELYMSDCAVIANQNLADNTNEDIYIHYSKNDDKDQNMTPKWISRFDGKFVSKGSNIFGAAVTKVDGIASDMTFLDSDIVYVKREVTTKSEPSSSGSGGCNGGFASLALLAVIPALARRKK